MTGGSTDLARPWGQRLRTWREEIKGWSQQELVDEIVRASFVTKERRGHDLGVRLVNRWESGETARPQAVYRRLLAYLGGPLPPSPARSAPVLPVERPPDIAVTTSDSQDDGDVDRRDFLRASGAVVAAAGVAAAAAASEPWQRLQDALAGANRPDAPTVDAIERQTRALFDLEERAPAGQVVDEASSHLNTVSDLIGSAHDNQLRTRLISQAGTSAALAGWLAFDQGQGAHAERYYAVAERAAEQAGDVALLVCVRTYRSYLADARGNPCAGAQLLSEALETLPRGGEPVMRAWLSARQAESAVALGNCEGALRAFDRAYMAQELTNGEQPMWTRFFTPTRLDGMAVAGYARLNHPDMDAAAERLLAAAGDRQTKVQQIALADLAYAYLERGDIERGAELGQTALDDITRSDTRVGYDRLAVIARALAPYRHSRVASGLQDQLAATLRV